LDEYRDASIERLGAKKPPESWHFPAAERAENRRCIHCRSSDFQETIICPIPLSVKQRNMQSGASPLDCRKLNCYFVPALRRSS
jgi:hypothetical protein